MQGCQKVCNLFLGGLPKLRPVLLQQMPESQVQETRQDPKRGQRMQDVLHQNGVSLEPSAARRCNSLSGCLLQVQHLHTT